MKKQDLIIVRGGGDIATGTIHRLYSAGFQVLVLEAGAPAAIRRQVAFSEAVYDGTAQVEGVETVRIFHEIRSELSEEEMTQIWKLCREAWNEGKIPLAADPGGILIARMHPAVVVDAILAKRNLGTNRTMAPLTIGLGPGFTAGEDVDAVIETMRGHNLGRIITEGSALPDTKVPGNIGGYTSERVIHAQEEGILYHVRKIGDIVRQGEEIAYIKKGQERIAVSASISGIIRGLIRDGYPVVKGFKIADIDPREGEVCNCFTISDKARCIAGSVLELICSRIC